MLINLKSGLNAQKRLAEMRLAHFVRIMWPTFDPADYTTNWHIDATCDHLEAINKGQIKRLLINIPPRTCKSGTVSICWPVWTWIQDKYRAGRLSDDPLSDDFESALGLFGAGRSFMFASYAESLALEHAKKRLNIIQSRQFQERWGDKIHIARDPAWKIDLEEGGYCIASSVDGKSTGFGADILVADDPHRVKETESDKVRKSVVDWWSETMPSRLNDRRSGAMVIVMQRVHEGDLSGYVLENELGYEHLMLPMEFDQGRPIMTCLGFEDPRKEDGDLLWPERFPKSDVEDLKAELGSYAAAGQLQQEPTPRGGGIFKKDWWQLYGMPRLAPGEVPSIEYEQEAKQFEQSPPLDLVIASVDTAYTDKDVNDPSAMTVWGVYTDENDVVKVLLLHAWREFLEFNKLLTKITTTCRKYRVEKVLVEAKASGISIIQEMRRVYQGEGWSVVSINPNQDGGGDKVARAHSVVNIFEDGIVYAPDKDWADLVIKEAEVFPKGRYKDLTDTVTQAMRYLRKLGILKLKPERNRQAFRSREHKRQEKPLYAGR